MLKLWSAFARLINAINALADTISEANLKARAKLDLDAPETPETPETPCSEPEARPETEPTKKRRSA